MHPVSKINRLPCVRQGDVFLFGLLINFAENFSMKSLLDSVSDILLSDDDEERTEDDERESETIFDEDEVEVIVLSLC